MDEKVSTNIYDYLNQDEAYLLINMSVLQVIVELIGKCPQCPGKLEIFNDLERRKGFAYLLKLRCKECLWEYDIYTSSKVCNSNKVGPKFIEMNLRMVLAFREIGRGLTALETFSQCMNMPSCIKQTSFDSIQKSLANGYLEVSRESQSKAAYETFQECSGDAAVADCNVSVDGTWQRRGYSSLNGVVTLMSNVNQKCIDTHVMSKCCKGCQNWERRKETEGDSYEIWKNDHNCSINHTGSSGAMEVSGAITMFKRSVDSYNLRYKGYIGDGDTKAHQSVVKAKPYGDVVIEKLECIGHVQKRVGSRLRNLVKDMRGKKLSDGKPLSGKGRLTMKAINKLQNYYGMAIRQNTSSVYLMKKSVAAVLFHCSQHKSLDDQHKFCPRTPDSWCKYQQDKLSGASTYKSSICLPSAVKDALAPIFKDLSSDELLSKCLHGQTQNVNEALHKMIWQRCPKENYTSKVAVELATASAVVHFNEGSGGLINVMRKLGIKPGRFMLSLSKRKDKRRYQDSVEKSSERGKKRRKHLRAKKKGFEDTEKETEGETYSSGAF